MYALIILGEKHMQMEWKTSLIKVYILSIKKLSICNNEQSIENDT